MRLGALKNWLPRRRSEGVLALEIRDSGIAWSCMSPGNSLKTGFQPLDEQVVSREIESLLTELPGPVGRVRLVLPPTDYQVFQLERPEGVNDEELADAFKWKLRDLIDFSPSEAVCDVFDFPADAARGGQKLVNVVVARRSLLGTRVEAVRSLGLEIETIEIAHLTLRNIAASLDLEERGLALVHLREAFGHMVICRGDTLYLSRSLDVSSEHLRDASRQEDSIQALALEIQRSLDYFESQLGQLPPSTLVLAGQDVALPVKPMLSPYIGPNVMVLDHRRLHLDEAPDPRCLAVLGSLIPMTMERAA